MRKIFFLICLLSSLCAMAQKTIFMEKEAGVYKIPCKVNGAKMKMIFDTGASSVAISLPIAEYLYENDYITKDDIIGTGKAQVADGRIVNNLVINLRDIEVAGIHVKNVKATVSESLTAPLLFGQSAIQKLGKISLHGNRLTIENAYNADASGKKCDELDKNANIYYKQKKYSMAIRNLLKLENTCGLSASGYFMLCYSYYYLDEYKNCYDAAMRFEQYNQDELDEEDAGITYKIVAITLSEDKYYAESVKWCTKAIRTLNQYNDTEEDLEFLYYLLAQNQQELNEYYKSIEAYKKAIEIRCDLSLLPKEGVADDEMLGTYYFNLAGVYQDYSGDNDNYDTIKYLRKALQCGRTSAREYLSKMGY